MAHRVFEIHDVEAFERRHPDGLVLALAGVGAQEFRLTSADGIDLCLVADPLGRSIALTAERDGKPIVHVTREGAVTLRFGAAPPAPDFEVEFQTEDTAGVIRVFASDNFRVMETSLFS